MGSESFETNVMALVAWLVYNGVKPSRSFWRTHGGRDTCWWEFDTPVADLVREYEDEEARVEPKMYNRIFAALRRQMFESRG